MGVWVVVAVFLAVVAVVLALGSLRIVKEYERGVAFRLGRLRGPLGPGGVVMSRGYNRVLCLVRPFALGGRRVAGGPDGRS